MPTLLYGLLWWRNNEAGYTYTELLCIYGYSLAIYIPISVRTNGFARLNLLEKDMAHVLPMQFWSLWIV